MGKGAIILQGTPQVIGAYLDQTIESHKNKNLIVYSNDDINSENDPVYNTWDKSTGIIVTQYQVRDGITTIPGILAVIGATETTLNISSAQTISASVAIPATLSITIKKPGLITIATGQTLTINGPFEAGLYQVFDCVGTGSVVFGSGNIKEVYPEWWTVNTTPGTTDMTTAVQAAVICAGINCPTVLQRTTYLISDTLDINIPGQYIRGERNAQYYGPGGIGSILKFTVAGVAVNSYDPAVSAYNRPYITLQDLSIDGNSTATIGFDGGFVTKLLGVNITGCTVAGLRIAKEKILGHGMASFYDKCSFNGNYDGVVWFPGANTQYFSNCFIRQNTNYGMNIGDAGSVLYVSASTISNSIIESNTKSGLVLAGYIKRLHFINVYFEANDVAAAPNAYQIIANILGTSTGIVFDVCPFASVTSVLVINLLAGRVEFNHCSQVGTTLLNNFTVGSGAEIVLNKSFQTVPAPVGVKIIPEVYVDPLSAMVFTNTGDGINISALGISFGVADFTVSFIIEPDRAAVDHRDICGYAANCFSAGLTGSIVSMTSLVISKVNVGNIAVLPCDLRADVPYHIVYSRISGVGYAYHNGILLSSFADATDYSGTISRIGRKSLAGDVGMNAKLYAFSFLNVGLTATQVWVLWKNSGSCLAAGLINTTLDLQFTNRTATTIYNSVSAGQLAVLGATHWTNPIY